VPPDPARPPTAACAGCAIIAALLELVFDALPEQTGQD
jgi:hypothetical protein